MITIVIVMYGFQILKLHPAPTTPNHNHRHPTTLHPAPTSNSEITS